MFTIVIPMTIVKKTLICIQLVKYEKKVEYFKLMAFVMFYS